MAKKVLRDMKSAKAQYNFPDDMHSRELREYYFIFDETRLSGGKDQALIKRFDANGIPINKTYIDVTDKDYVYFPISIGQMGLAIFHTWLKSGAENDKQRFLKFADWFYANADMSDTLGARWLTDVALPQYHNPGPWQSAFSQSRGISILLRSYQLTGNKAFAEMAEKALTPFTVPVSDGGVRAATTWGPFYEEYTSTEPTLVLNGFIFALCGLHEFTRVFPENTLAMELFNDGLDTLEKILPEYDMGFWSRYNLCRANWHPAIDPATVSYQRLHATQLKMLHKLTGRPVFNTFSEHFYNQISTVHVLRAYAIKYKALKKIGRL